MKILTRALLFSTFLILAMSQDPCAQAFKSAEENLSQFRSDFLANNFEITTKDLSSLSKNIQDIQKTCKEGLPNHLHSPPHMSCSLIRLQMISILENFAWDKMTGAPSRNDLNVALEEILAFLPKIESQECVDEWVFVRNANGVLNQDVVWSNALDYDIMTMGHIDNETELSYMIEAVEIERENSDSTDLSEIFPEDIYMEDFRDAHLSPYFDVEVELRLSQDAEENLTFVSLQEAIANTPQERIKQDQLISALFELDFDTNLTADTLSSDAEPFTDEEELD